MAQDGEVRQHPNGGTYVRQGGVWVLQGQAAPVAAPAAPAAPVHIPGPNLPEKRDDPPAGYRWAPDGVSLEKITGGPADKPDPGPKTVSLPDATRKELDAQISAFSALERAAKTFDPNYSGIGSGLESTAQSIYSGIGTPGQRDWWADFKLTDTMVRNAFFGASLTPGEQAAYAETTITPNMDAAEIKRNLERRRDLALSKLRRNVEFAKANKFEPAAIDALLGEYAPIISGAGQPSAEVPTNKLTSEQQAAYDALVKSGATADQIRAFGDNIGMRIENADDVVAARDKGRGTRSAADAVYNVPEETQRLKDATDQIRGTGGAIDLAVQGATLGLSDEAAGIGNFIQNAVVSPFTDAPFDPAAAYRAGKGAELLRLQDARQSMGGLGTAVEIGGGLLGGNPTNALAAAAPTLLGRMGQGVRGGAAGGALAGFGYGEGTENSLLAGAGGAALGAGIGAAIPVAGSVVSNRYQGMRRMLGRDPDLPRRVVGEAIAADANTPRSVGEMMDAARGRGSPLALADTGENARGLLASVGRQPGPARQITRAALIERQQAQFERIADAVRRDLGPTVNIRERGEELIEAARTAAAPLYEQFRAAPGASVVKIDDLMTRPAFKRAMKNALNLAQEEGADPTALGFQFNEAGDVILERAPSWETLDYVKRGLDDVVEEFRDGTTGRLNLNTGQSRATNATLRTLINRMDKVNPTYAAARAAYAGPARMREALEKGSKALRRAPDDITAEMRDMGEPEREMYRTGLRKAIVDMLASRVDGGDKVAALIGTPKSRAALTRAFGGRAEFDRFIATLRDEEAMGQTYRAVATGSPTAERMAFDATTNDTGLAETAVDAALRGGKDGMWPALVSALQRLREVDRLGVGQAGENAREGIAALLTETDPAVLQELIAAATRAAERQALSGQNAGRRAARVGLRSGQLIGSGIGSQTAQPVR